MGRRRACRRRNAPRGCRRPAERRRGAALLEPVAAARRGHSRRQPADRLASTSISIDSRGVLRDGGRTLSGPLVVDGYASTVELRSARKIASGPRDRLFAPRGVARVRMYVIGRSTDGLLVSSRGAILFWADRPGVLVVHVDGSDLHVGDKAIKGSRLLRLPVCDPGRFALGFRATIDRLVGGRPAGGRMSLPRFVPGRCHG